MIPAIEVGYISFQNSLRYVNVFAAISNFFAAVIDERADGSKKEVGKDDNPSCDKQVIGVKR